jgi:hypothetical protein
MHNIRQLYPRVKYRQAYLFFSKTRGVVIARYIRRYGSFGDEKEYKNGKSKSDSNKRENSGKEDQTHEGQCRCLLT